MTTIDHSEVDPVDLGDLGDFSDGGHASSTSASHVVTKVITPKVNLMMHSMDCILAEIREEEYEEAGREPVAFPELGRDLVVERASCSDTEEEAASMSPRLRRRRLGRSVPHQLSLSARTLSWEDNWLFCHKKGMSNTSSR